MATLKPTFYGIIDIHHKITVERMYPGGFFIEKAVLKELTGSQIIQLGYFSLKTHIKSKIGPHKKYNGVPLRCPHKKTPIVQWPH